MTNDVPTFILAGTYRRKAKRDLTAAMTVPTNTEVLKAQEMILKEMGPDACVYEKVCSAYARATMLAKKDGQGNAKEQMDWEKIIR